MKDERIDEESIWHGNERGYTRCGVAADKRM